MITDMQCVTGGSAYAATYSAVQGNCHGGIDSHSAWLTVQLPAMLASLVECLGSSLAVLPRTFTGTFRISFVCF